VGVLGVIAWLQQLTNDSGTLDNSRRKLGDMRQRAKLIGIVVAVSAVAGSLMYGLLMAMYWLADALSLSPVLKNLVPLAAIAFFWFIGSRSMKYFRHREDRRAVPPLGTASPSMRNMDEERRQAWLQIKAKGKKRYIWRTGVMGWGLSVFAIFTPVMLIFGPRTHQLSMAEIVGTTILSFFVWMVAGYFFGLSMWKTFDNKYR
jgi:hypothetical protein